MQPLLAERLRDQRSKKVVFLSHCLLNENTRYLGGACRRCCVREIIESCMDHGIGMVQMPCPEQAVWGGVLKRRMLRLYGLKRRSPLAHRLSSALVPLGLRYVRRRYRTMARAVATQVEDYVASGFTVLGIVGIDGSPTCGVHKTIDIDASVDEMSRVDPASLSVDEQNDMVRRHAIPGRGLFIEALERELRARRLRVPLLAHDLLGELMGLPSNVTIGEGA
ncbi:hypothetical protein BH11MYX4_BH11MYX4_65490 [soil metagenome]